MGKVTRFPGWNSRWLRIGAALAGLLIFAAAPAFSQGCALCYTQAASSGARMIAALKSGILILVVPPTLASVGMLFVVHHKRNQIRRDESGDDWSQDREQDDWGKDR
jgi:hypothetical protein